MVIYVTSRIYGSFLRSPEFVQVEPGGIGRYQGITVIRRDP